MRKRLGILIAAFVTSFILMGLLCLSSVQLLKNYIFHSQLLYHSNTLIERLYDLEKDIRDLDRTERGYMLTKDTAYIKLVKRSVDNSHSHLDSLKSFTQSDPELTKQVRLLSGNLALRISALHRNMRFADTSAPGSLPTNYTETRSLMADCSSLLKKLHTQQTTTKEKLNNDVLYYEKLTSVSIKWLLIIFSLVTVVLFVLLINELLTRVKYQQELQTKVTDLKRSHTELQEIAYVASHDLQEPLRKIQVFSNMLLYNEDTKKSGNNRMHLERINNSAKRMQSLIADLMNLTSLTQTLEQKHTLDLNAILHHLHADMELKTNEVSAVIDLKLLPDIIGYEKQIKILFTELITNALKFRRPDVKPIITISCQTTGGFELAEISPHLNNKQFFRVEVSDNGIGFDKQFTEKMFKIFQRLHQTEAGYEGKGIGLAICQRIMANHDGYILAKGEPHLGATFKLYFPV